MGPINQQQIQKLKQLTVMSLATKSKVRGTDGRLGTVSQCHCSVWLKLQLWWCMVRAAPTKDGLLMPMHHCPAPSSVISNPAAYPCMILIYTTVRSRHAFPSQMAPPNSSP